MFCFEHCFRSGATRSDQYPSKLRVRVREFFFEIRPKNVGHFRRYLRQKTSKMTSILGSNFKKNLRVRVRRKKLFDELGLAQKHFFRAEG